MSASIRWMMLAFAPSIMRCAPPIPLAELYRQADAVLLGSVELAQPLPPRIEEGFTLDQSYPCEIKLRIKFPIRIDSTQMTPGDIVWIAASLPVTECSFDSPAQTLSRNSPVLLLLRRAPTGFRTVSSGSSAIFRLERPLLQTEEAILAQLSKPNLRLMYLFLTPGLIVPAERYPESSLPIQMVDIGGWIDFLKVFRIVFAQSTAFEQGQISVVAASFNHCAETAREFLRSKSGRSESGVTIETLDRRGAAATEEPLLKWMSWPDDTALLRAFKTPDAASNELTRWACSSLPRVRERARALLSRDFDVDPSTLPCLPCR